MAIGRITQPISARTRMVATVSPSRDHCQPKAWRARLAASLEQHLTIHAMLHTTEVIRAADEKRALFERTGASPRSNAPPELRGYLSAVANSAALNMLEVNG